MTHRAVEQEINNQIVGEFDWDLPGCVPWFAYQEVRMCSDLV